MGKTSRKLTVEIIGDSSSLNKAFKQAGDDSRKFGKKLGEAAKVGAAALAGLGIGAAVGLKKSIDAASDLNEQVNKSSVVFKDNGAEVAAWSKDLAQSFGLSSRAALEAAGTFGNMLVPMGFAPAKAAKMSKSLTELGGDLASFNNASIDETLTAISSGLAGETEPLRRFGVFLNQNRIIAEAVSSGLVKNVKDTLKVKQANLAVTDAIERHTKAIKEHGAKSKEAQKAQLALEVAEDKLNKAIKGKVPQLTAAQKAQATYNLILKDTKNAQGDFARTNTGLANSQRVAAAELENAAAQLGAKFIPLTAKALVMVNNLIPRIAAWSEEMQKRLGPTIERVRKFLTEVVAFVRKHWPEISRTVGKVAEDIQIVWAKIGPTLTKVFRIAAAAIVPILKGIATALKGVAQIIDGIIHGKWAEVWEGLKNVVTGVFKALKTALIAEAKIIKTYVSALARALAAIIKAPINAVIGKFNSLEVPKIKIKIPHVGSISTPAIGLPNIPKLDTGGDILKTGLAVVHRGERVIPTGRINDRPTTIIIQVAGRTVAEAILPDLERIGNRATASRRGRSGSVLLSTR